MYLRVAALLLELPEKQCFEVQRVVAADLNPGR
jgi:hypothetical protein